MNFNRKNVDLKSKKKCVVYYFINPLGAGGKQNSFVTSTEQSPSHIYLV